MQLPTSATEVAQSAEAQSTEAQPKRRLAIHLAEAIATEAQTVLSRLKAIAMHR